MKRGALIVFEGCDRSGKSTQCKRLVETLKSTGRKAEMMNFPDRTTEIGGIISKYLEKKCELHDKSVHLLFSANRWELVPHMKKLLNSGVSLVIDRYAYSGVAFSAAKEGLDLHWCKQPDIGLPKPDLVFFLDVPASVTSARGQFGEERYEKVEFQKRVASCYNELKESDWMVLDASQSIEDLQRQIQDITFNKIEGGLPDHLDRLWTSKDS